MNDEKGTKQARTDAPATQPRTAPDVRPAAAPTHRQGSDPQVTKDQSKRSGADVHATKATNQQTDTDASRKRDRATGSSDEEMRAKDGHGTQRGQRL